MSPKKPLAHVDAAEIAWDGVPKLYVDQREFSVLGDQRYAMKLLPAGIVFEVDRLRRERHELNGELLVRVNGNFPKAKTYEGVVSVGDFNFSSIQARSTRAKLLSDRAKNDDIDWYGLLEEFAVKVIKAERQGPNPIDLRSAPEEGSEAADVWDIAGFPILKQHPTVLYGSGGSGKSYFSMYVAGSLAELGLRVLYVDWEFSMAAHRKRFRKMFRPEPEGVLYLRCERPLREEADKIHRVILESKVDYAIFDSVGYACDGAPEQAEKANEYFRALRTLGVGSLNLGHVTKMSDDDRPQLFGSVYWQNSARAMWYMQAATENPLGHLRFGLYQRKNSQGPLLAARAYDLKFSDLMTTITETKLMDIDELAAVLPLFDRIKRHLKGEQRPCSAKELADALGTSQDAVRKTVSRHRSQFVILAGKVALKASEPLLEGVSDHDEKQASTQAEEF